MRVFGIYDAGKSNPEPIAYLYYYEKAKEFIIEMISDIDEWDAPLLFAKLVKSGIYTVPKELSRLWVQERVIPSGRQNIGQVLKTHHMSVYDEMKLLEISRGKCSQDECYIRELSVCDVPEEINRRSDCTITECFATENHNIICMFQDENVYKIKLELLQEKHPDIRHVLANPNLYESVKVDVGGYAILFADSIGISARELKNEKYITALRAADFIAFAEKNLLATSQVCERMGCSKQNVSYLVKTCKLKPVVETAKERLFTKGQVERAMWG